MEGAGAAKFAREAGGHRWQEVSGKNEKIHTSTFTVAVLPEQTNHKSALQEKDLKWNFARGSGKGGQHRNKKDTCVQLTHLPTKLTVRIDGRSQPTNKALALQILEARVAMYFKRQASAKRDKERKDQRGSGQRGDKVRTIRVKDGIVTNHVSGKKTSLKKYLAGNFDELF